MAFLSRKTLESMGFKKLGNKKQSRFGAVTYSSKFEIYKK